MINLFKACFVKAHMQVSALACKKIGIINTWSIIEFNNICLFCSIYFIYSLLNGFYYYYIIFVVELLAG